MFDADTAYWLILLWLVAVGGAVGSFLNVVVYRLPQGISIVHPPSHCPKCGKSIPWYDNIPVFGWIVLRGRCRQCREPISARYPIVEAVTAAMFGLVAVAEMPYIGETGVFGLYPFHMLLLCTLLCAGLIEFDGNRVPWKLFVPALVVGVVAPLFSPELRPWCLGWRETPMWLGATVNGLAGLIVGALLGIVAWRTLTRERPKGLAIGLVCVGLSLGGCAVSVIAVVATVLIAPMWLPERVSPGLRVPGSMVLAVVTLIWILTAGWILVLARLVSG